MPKVFLAASVVVALLAFFGSILIYTSSSLIKSRSSLENMVNQQTVEKKLEEQNERYYNDIYERYETAIRNLDDYQTDTNNQMEHIRDRLDKLEDRMNIESSGDNNITINNNSSNTYE